MSELTLTVDGIPVTVPRGSTVMQPADQAGIHLPRVCYHPRLSMERAGRVCAVEVEGLRNLGELGPATGFPAGQSPRQPQFPRRLRG